jgi:hypothetical protein
MNDAWTKGNPDDLDQYFHRDMVAITPSDNHRLDGGAACIAGWKGFVDSARIHRWEEIEPVIHIYGDSAVVAYYYSMTVEMSDEILELEGRDMLFMAKEDGRWWVVADQFSSYPG